MEDLKAYIESGILELYVLGELSLGEKSGVEAMLNKYPELQKELREIEEALETYAEKHALEPDEDVFSSVISVLDFDKETQSEKPPASKFERQRSFYKYAFAASIALLLLCIAALFNLNNKLKESRLRITQLEDASQKIAARANYIEKKLSDTQQALAVFRNPKDYKLVELKGTPKAPDAKMLIAFNPAEEVVMIDAASLEMPETDEQHQYQLWALVDGKPIDLGVFDAETNSRVMIKMKPLKTAQAFAVTLEPRGGSEKPTLSQLIVMGEI